MGEERKRIKRAEVSEQTRQGQKRAAVNPNARKNPQGGKQTGKGNAS